MVKSPMPSSAIASCWANTASASASSEVEPSVSRSHWVNSRNRPRPGRSARQTEPMA